MPHDWLDLLSSEWWSLLGATAAHLELVVEAVTLAVLVGVPLGILAARRPLLERTAVGVSGVLQTVPSLALLGFLLIAFRGQIGKAPALAALVLYALLPIVKNTILGLQSIDPGVREAALGARGLGSYIFRGVALSDTRLILLGSVPSALLALGCDAALGEAERLLDPARARNSRRRGWIAALAVGLLLAFAAWGWLLDHPMGGSNRATITIGSKDGSEMILLGHMLADLVQAHTPLRVDRRFNLGGTLVCYNALRLGGLDAYVEYTGTALTTILKAPVQTDPQAVLERVRKELKDRDHVVCLDPFGF